MEIAPEFDPRPLVSRFVHIPMDSTVYGNSRKSFINHFETISFSTGVEDDGILFLLVKDKHGSSALIIKQR